uniref:Protein lifeguard 2 n=1 Tax=Lygus hesperus TaxID=30085 RepID=A0A0A9WF27_LYGHE
MESGYGEYGMGFDDASIRRGFIRKVYGLLFSQLLITLSFIAVFCFSDKVSGYVQQNPWTLILALVLSFVLIIILSCCGQVRRTAPTNYILLFLFTIVEGYLLGAISSSYTTQSVLIAAGLTALITFLLTIFSFQTKYDVTGWGCGLFIILIVFTIVGMIAGIFLRGNQVYQMIYGGIGAAIFCLYIIYDTQLMMGGKHKYSLSPEEYVFASLNLYLDVINLFLMLLQLLGSRD